jgi:putative transposase
MVSKKEDSAPPKKRRKTLECRKTLSEDGRTKGCSHPSEHLEDNDSTTSPSTSEVTPTLLHNTAMPQSQSNGSHTVESLPKAKRTTSKGKLPTCKTSSQTTKSLPTLDPESTSVEKASGPSWTSLAKESSPKLWLPTEIGCVASRSNWFNGSFSSMESNSWFSIKKWTPQDKENLPKTSWPLSMCSIAESMEGENIKELKARTSHLKKSKKLSANYCKKIGLSPTPEVAQQLKNWFGSVRYTYNWALERIKDKPKEYPINVNWLRKRFVRESSIPKSKKFLTDTPKHVRDSALHDLVEAYKSNFAKKRKNPEHHFDLKFRKKKDAQSITIPYNAINCWDTEKKEFSMYPTYITNKIKFHCRKKRSVPKGVQYDCKLLLDKLGKFFLVVTYHVTPCESQTGTCVHEWCSIDPGVRTMLTVYSPSYGVCYKIGQGDIGRIFRLCKGLDRLISLTESSSTKQSRKRMRRAQTVMRARIQHLVKEVHCKAIHFILTNFRNIVIPPFNVSQMVKRSNRRIRSTTVRQMLCWKHYTFRTRMLEVAKRFPSTNVYVRGEEYTSKTCTHCQAVKYNLGGSKVYACNHCGLLADRDVCGSRNIFLKNCFFL